MSEVIQQTGINLIEKTKIVQKDVNTDKYKTIQFLGIELLLTKNLQDT